MSYRLITKATFTILSATGVKSERDVEVRAYPSPKRDASGAIDVNGVTASYKRTGGKGRGTADNRYMYAPVKGESAYWAITEAEAAALVGGLSTLVSAVPTKLEALIDKVGEQGLTPEIAKEVADAVEAGIAEHGLKVTDYTSGTPVDASIPPAPKLSRAQRRAAKQEA